MLRMEFESNLNLVRFAFKSYSGNDAEWCQAGPGQQLGNWYKNTDGNSQRPEKLIEWGKKGR